MSLARDFDFSGRRALVTGAANGFGAAIDWWDKIAPELATNYRVIRLDLIGHGGTAAPRSGYSIERQAMLVSAILDQLGVERFTVVDANNVTFDMVTMQNGNFYTKQAVAFPVKVISNISRRFNASSNLTISSVSPP